jgi:hypothetical protein
VLAVRDDSRDWRLVGERAGILLLALSLALLPNLAWTAAPPERPEPVEEPSSYESRSRQLTAGGGEVWAVAISPCGKRAAAVAGGTGDNPGDLTL